MTDAQSPTGNTSAKIEEKTFKAGLAKLWSAGVVERGYTVLPTLLLWGQGRLGIDNDELAILLQIISHRWRPGETPFLGKATIAARMGRAPRTVQRYVTSLESKGLLTRVTRRKLHKGQDANGFDLTGLINKLKMLAPEFKKAADQSRRRKQAVQIPKGAQP